MKQLLNYKTIAKLFTLLMVISTSTIMGQVYEKSKHLSESYAINENTEIQVNNKYGNIHLVTWEKDSVRFEIDVLVKATKQVKVDKIYEFIDFEFAATEYYIIVNTRFKDSRSKFWTEISDVAKTIFSSDNKAQIDYRVYVPENNPLKITNKFGNIYTTNHTGEFNVELSNGDIKVNDLFGNSKIKVEFGSANINYIQKGTMSVDYSDCTLDEADTIHVKSKSSTIQLGDIGEMEINTRRDKIYVNSIISMNANASFSYLNIKNLGNLMVSSSKYGEITIDAFNEAFQMFNCIAEYTDITINLPVSVSFDLEIDHNEKTILDYPSSFENVQKTAKDADKESFVTYGYVGEKVDNPARIDINARSGKVIIRQF